MVANTDEEISYCPSRAQQGKGKPVYHIKLCRLSESLPVKGTPRSCLKNGSGKPKPPPPLHPDCSVSWDTQLTSHHGENGREQSRRRGKTRENECQTDSCLRQHKTCEPISQLSPASCHTGTQCRQSTSESHSQTINKQVKHCGHQTSLCQPSHKECQTDLERSCDSTGIPHDRKTCTKPCCAKAGKKSCVCGKHHPSNCKADNCCKNRASCESKHYAFPFLGNTPSGNLKVRPDMISFENKEFGILVADPCAIRTKVKKLESGGESFPSCKHRNMYQHHHYENRDRHIYYSCNEINEIRHFEKQSKKREIFDDRSRNMDDPRDREHLYSHQGREPMVYQYMQTQMDYQNNPNNPFAKQDFIYSSERPKAEPQRLFRKQNNPNAWANDEALGFIAEDFHQTKLAQDLKKRAPPEVMETFGKAEQKYKEWKPHYDTYRQYYDEAQDRKDRSYKENLEAQQNQRNSIPHDGHQNRRNSDPHDGHGPQPQRHSLPRDGHGPQPERNSIPRDDPQTRRNSIPRDAPRNPDDQAMINPNNKDQGDQAQNKEPVSSWTYVRGETSNADNEEALEAVADNHQDSEGQHHHKHKHHHRTSEEEAPDLEAELDHHRHNNKSFDVASNPGISDISEVSETNHHRKKKHHPKEVEHKKGDPEIPPINSPTSLEMQDTMLQLVAPGEGEERYFDPDYPEDEFLSNDEYYKKREHTLSKRQRSADLSKSDENMPVGVLPNLDKPNGLVLLFGGINPRMPWGRGNTGRGVYLYTPETNKWERVGSLPQPRAHFGLVRLGSYVYLVGGTNPEDKDDNGKNTPVGSVLRLDLRSGQWDTLNDFGTPRSHFGCVCIAHHIYIIGGNQEGRATKSCLTYNTVTQSSTEIAPLGIARSSMGICMYGTGIMIAGGTTKQEARPVLETVSCYTPMNNKWNPWVDLPSPRAFCTLVVVKNQVYLVAGAAMKDKKKRGNSSLPDVLCCKDGSDTWIEVGMLSTPRHGHTAVALGDSIIVIGGISSHTMGALNSVEIFNTTNGLTRIAQNISQNKSGTGAIVL